MIARIWRGWAPLATADDYQRHYETEVSGHLRAVSGFRGARLLRRDDGPEVMVKAPGSGSPARMQGCRASASYATSWDVKPWAARINGMRILADCPRVYRTLACGADVPET
jgi:hypothetical protein